MKINQGMQIIIKELEKYDLKKTMGARITFKAETDDIETFS